MLTLFHVSGGEKKESGGKDEFRTGGGGSTKRKEQGFNFKSKTGGKEGLMTGGGVIGRKEHGIGDLNTDLNKATRLMNYGAKNDIRDVCSTNDYLTFCFLSF